MKSLSAVKYDLMMVGHIFLNDRVPKDYAAKVWKTIVDNKLLVEKKALTEQSQDSFGILAKQFPEFSSEEPHSAIGKICRMLCRFACVNCINFSEVGTNELIFSSQLSVVSHVIFLFYTNSNYGIGHNFIIFFFPDKVLWITSDLILNNLIFLFILDSRETGVSSSISSSSFQL